MLKSKHGDTLIEVTIAIGIFSMIAIAVAAVMSSGTSGSQLALETTLTREEIDAQAEALRFIHSSYTSSKNVKQTKDTEDTTDENPYQQLWQSIVDNAISKDDISTDITQYSPASCDELYTAQSDPGSPKTDIYQQKAFILDLKQLSSKNAYLSANKANVFYPATTYPRLLFGNSGEAEEDSGSLTNTSVNSVSRAEGIYIIAVKDADGTQIIQNGAPTKASAFYDFYIRTCWYGNDANRPSTISTLVRLYNPDIGQANT